MDGGDARPVVDRLAEFVLDGEAADDPLGFARLDTHRGHPGAEAERAVVAAADEVVGLGEEGAGDLEADAGEGEEDGEVVGAFLGGMSLGEGLEQFAEVPLCLCEELLGDAGLGAEGGERPDGSLGGSGGDDERRGLEDVAQGGCCQPPDPVLFQEVTESSEGQPAGFLGSLGLFPQLEEPGKGRRVAEAGDLEELGEVTPELLPDLVAVAGGLPDQFVAGPGALPQLEDEGVLQGEPAEEVGIGTQGTGHHPGGLSNIPCLGGA